MMLLYKAFGIFLLSMYLSGCAFHLVHIAPAPECQCEDELPAQFDKTLNEAE